MTILKYSLLFWSLLCICAVLQGLQSPFFGHVGVSLGSPSSALIRIYTLAMGVIFAAGFYGIQRRKIITWKLGWFFLIWTYINGISYVITTMYFGHDSIIFDDFWAPVIAYAFFGGLVLIYWGHWWNPARFRTNQRQSYQNIGPNRIRHIPSIQGRLTMQLWKLIRMHTILLSDIKDELAIMDIKLDRIEQRQKKDTVSERKKTTRPKPPRL